MKRRQSGDKRCLVFQVINFPVVLECVAVVVAVVAVHECVVLVLVQSC